MPQFSPMKWMVISLVPFITIMLTTIYSLNTKVNNKPTMWKTKKMNWKW